MGWYFAYGSNNIKQLQERLQKINLIIYPGVIYNYKRIYTGYNKAWDSSVATIIKARNHLVLGSLVYMSETDLDILDTYEPHYNRKSIKVTIIDNNTNVNTNNDNNYIINASIYLHKTRQVQCNPSSIYLKACYNNINYVWDIGLFKKWVETEIVIC